MIILHEQISKYSGKVLSHFEDQDGNKLDNLTGLDSLTIVFTDSTRINIKEDWRGNECYFSQYLKKENN